MIVAGDFNAKIGCVEGAFGKVDEFVDLLPLAAESSDCNDAGAEMLGIFLELEFLRLPFTEGGAEKLTFILLPTEEQPDRSGGRSWIMSFSHLTSPSRLPIRSCD